MSTPIKRAFRKAFFAAWLFWQQRRRKFREPMHHKLLRIPLYELYYIGEIREGSKTYMKKWVLTYKPEMLEKILAALMWANENPDFNFRGLLPNIGHSNEDIVRFLRMFLRQALEAKTELRGGAPMAGAWSSAAGRGG